MTGDIFTGYPGFDTQEAGLYHAARQGSAEAQYGLASYYLQEFLRLGKEYDQAAIINSYRQTIRRDGFFWATGDDGRRVFFDGDRFETLYAEALDWLCKAARQDYAPAQDMLARLGKSW